MAIHTVAVSVPPQGLGPAVDVSSIVGSKTVQLSGTFDGYYDLLGSQDDVNYVAIASFDSGSPAGIQTPVEGAVKSVRLLANVRSASGVTCTISGTQGVGQNGFCSVASLVAGSSGLTPSVDTSHAIPPTGSESDTCLLCVGDFEGSIIVLGSSDNSQFNPLGEFQLARLPEGTPTPVALAPLLISAKVRYVRLQVNAIVRGPTSITLGGRVPAYENSGQNGFVIAPATIPANSGALTTVTSWSMPDPSTWSPPGPATGDLLVDVELELVVYSRTNPAISGNQRYSFTVQRISGAWALVGGVVTGNGTISDQGLPDGYATAVIPSVTGALIDIRAMTGTGGSLSTLKGNGTIGYPTMLTVDPAVPTVIVTSPTPAFAWYVGETHTISGTYSDNGSSVSGMRVYLGSTDLGSPIFSGGVWSISHTLVSGEISPSVAIRASATNSVGTTTSASVVGTVSAVSAPTGTIFAPSPGFTAAAGSPLVASGNVNPRGAATTVHLFLGSTDLGPCSVVGTTWTFSGYTWQPGDVGAVALSAQFTNIMGSTSSGTVNGTISAAPSAPTGDITNPSAGFSAAMGSSLTVGGNVNQNGATTTVHVFNGATDLGAGIVTGSTWSFTGYTWLVGDVGAASLTAHFVNSAGSSTSPAVTGTVTAIAPTGSITSPAGGFEAGTGTPLVANGTVSQNGAATTVHVFNGATDLGAGTVTGSTWSFSGYTWQPGDVGAVSLTAHFTNSAGSSVSAAVAGTISSSVSPPTGAITSPSGGFTAHAGSILSVSGTVNQNGATTTVHVFNGATDLGAGTVTDSSWSFNTYTWQPGDLGAASLTAHFTNSAGSTVSAAVAGTVLEELSASVAAASPSVYLFGRVVYDVFEGHPFLTMTGNDSCIETAFVGSRLVADLAYGTFLVSIDGGAPTTFVVDTGSGFRPVTIATGLTDTQHTVKITSGLSYMWLGTDAILTTYGSSPSFTSPPGYGTMVHLNSAAFDTFGRITGGGWNEGNVGEYRTDCYQWVGHSIMSFRGSATDLYMWGNTGRNIAIYSDGIQVATFVAPGGANMSLLHLATGLDPGEHEYSLVVYTPTDGYHTFGVCLMLAGGTGPAASPPAALPTILWFGDSIVANQGGTDVDDMRQGDQWNTAQNAAVGAQSVIWCTPGMLMATAITEAQYSKTSIPPHAQVVVLENGGGDLFNGTTLGNVSTPGTFAGDALILLQNVAASLTADSVILWRSIIPCHYTNWENRDTYNAALKAAVDAYMAGAHTAPAYYIATNNWILDTPGIDLAPDGDHVNEAGLVKLINREMPIMAGLIQGESYHISAPSGGVYTVSLPAAATFTGDQQITISDGGAGGTITPSVGAPGVGSVAVTPTATSPTFTFIYTPPHSGTFNLSFSADQDAWTNPAPVVVNA